MDSDGYTSDRKTLPHFNFADKDPTPPEDHTYQADATVNLMAILEVARQGGVSAASKIFPWNRQQIEALWDNLAAGWSIGVVVALDASDSDDVRWQKCFGPWRTRPYNRKRTVIIAGAEKITALAWSLYPDPLTSLQERLSPEETAIWDAHTLVVEPSFRRIRFVAGTLNPARHLPIWMLPDAGRCARAMSKMEISRLDRDWVNQTARRLMEARVTVHMLPWHEYAVAEHLIENLRQIGALP